MVGVRKYVSEDRSAWNDFVAGAKNGLFMFNRNYMEYHADRFEDHSLMFHEEGQLIAVMPASRHGDEIRSHGGLTFGGIVTDGRMKQHRMNDCFEALMAFMKEIRIGRLLYKPTPYIYHRVPSQEDLYPLWRHGAVLVRRDVSTTIDLGQRLKMPKGRKAQISRARREGVRVEESEDFKAFLILENQVLSERHNVVAVHTEPELVLLKSRFPDAIHLFVAEQAGDMLAAVLVFEYESLVHTQYMASSERGRQIGALDFLVGELMEKYAETKRYLDFGISTELAGTVFNSGLCSQKEGFGGRSVVYDSFGLEV